MSISFSGLASGLDTSAWVEALVSVKQEKITTLQTDLKEKQQIKTTLNDTRSTVSSLRSAIEKLTDAKFGGDFDLFAKNSAKSSNEEIFTASAVNGAVRQNYNISVQQLATYTKATSKEAASAIADDETKLSSLGISVGTLTTYINGKKETIDINNNTTLGEFKTELSSIGINTEINETGTIKFSAIDENNTINIGATTDKTNLISLIGMEKQEDGKYISTNSLFKASVSSKLTSEDSGFTEQITTGTFSIGDATFTINENTTLSSIISEINNNKNAQAYAYWDDSTGKLSITSTKEGASYINIEAGTSNFTDVMGFTTTQRDENGDIINSKMLTETQELGKNALFKINGTSMVSTSNTVTSDISRMEGVTLNLKRVTKDDEGDTILEISQDSSQLKNAVNEFITAYNNMISKIDEVTANGANLHGETTLSSLQNSIRSLATGSNTSNGGAFKLLSEIGISTSNADANNLSADTNTLKLDETKFLKALEKDPESVKSILSSETGILGLMENSVEQSLKATVGFFDVKTSTLDSDINRMQTNITTQNKKVETYKKQLEDKFYKMELTISQMQQNYSSFLSG